MWRGYLRKEGLERNKIKTPLSVIQPSVFSDYFLVIHFQIWHKISNPLLLSVDVLKHHTINKSRMFAVLCKQLDCISF